MTAIKKYFEEAIHELRQVQWPTRNHAIRISIISAIFVASSIVAIAIVDYFLNQLLLFTH